MFEDKKERWLEIAERLKPALRHETVRPVKGLLAQPLQENDELVLDFGNHHVGHLTLTLASTGSHPDAPAWIELKFCESARELEETLDGYRGWISKGWVQQEQLHVDVLPATITLPRRYAFRYVKLRVLAVSSKYALTVEDAFIDATTSAGESPAPYQGTWEDAAIERVALRTLRSCMQEVFEDGPKRDRRLWLGDLRLQALANYASYQNDDLVKRCLYLFAAAATEEGRLPACVFTEPKLEADDTFMFDYALFFIAALRDYVSHTGDRETGRDLLPVASRQLELAEAEFDADGIVRDRDALGWCFIDWNLNLNKQASAQAVWIYAAKAYEALLAVLGMPEDAELCQRIEWRSQAAIRRFYDAKRRLFISGEERQVSWAIQVWMVLAGVLEGEAARDCLLAVEGESSAEKIVTPYMMHHYIDALCQAGLCDKAHKAMDDYWGGMVSCGADTFWELYNPDNPEESPYGSAVVNSYCHAWSCTPAWFLRSGRLEEV